ncbi:MAG TPA: hypothetical protein VEF04_05680, partial [Blastocatellia bacterium]|nr:hypothetical protein [Blastocatellia bacterium]
VSEAGRDSSHTPTVAVPRIRRTLLSFARVSSARDGIRYPQPWQSQLYLELLVYSQLPTPLARANDIT